jgi:hypothetical protein
MNGRTSIGVVVARASLRAHASAASRSAARMTEMPPICSLLSMNGRRHDVAGLVPDDRGRGRGIQAAAEHPGSGRPQLIVHGVHVVHDLAQRLGCGLRAARGVTNR